jgi:hypothetical protein
MAAPAAIPMALSVVIALAGPGGALEVNGDPARQSHPQPHTVQESVDTGAAATVETAAPANADIAPTAPLTDTEAPVVTDTNGSDGDGRGCVEALTERAESRDQLQSHVDDPSKPEGGAVGNENALDHQCGGAFAKDSAAAPAANAPEPPITPNEETTPADTGNGNGNGNANGHDNPADKSKDGKD